MKFRVKSLKYPTHATRSAHFKSPDLIMWRLTFIEIRLEVQVLGAFIKLRKAAVTFVVSVRPFASNNWTTTGRIFVKFYIGEFHEILSRKFKFLLKNQNRRHFTWIPNNFLCFWQQRMRFNCTKELIVVFTWQHIITFCIFDSDMRSKRHKRKCTVIFPRQAFNFSFLARMSK
jgi:hypothetical protein